MKRRLSALILALALALSLLPVSVLAANVEDYKILGSNFNTAAVQNGPTDQNVITVKNAARIKSVTTYHWNNGQGAAPGTITVYEDGKPIGTWQATGRSSSGVANTLWDIFPDFVMEPGREYTFSTSSDETWSWNSGTQGAGMIELRGGTVGTTPAGYPDTPATPSGTTSNGYTCSKWAQSEVAKADSYGLIPASLAGGDLTRPISRADFAAVSLRTYQRMSGQTAGSPGSNPFTDTSDPEVLKAYGLGIVNGTSATTFDPSGNLTREQASTMLTRAYKKIVLPGWTLAADSSYQLQYTKPAPFADQSSISSYAADSVAFMAAQGIVNGVGNNRFDPKNNVTREQALAIAVRMADNLDTTPQTVTPVTPEAGGKSEGPASGTLTNGDCSLTFKTAQPGQAVLVQDGEGYDLLLTDELTGTVEVTLPAPAADGAENVVYLGIPYIDDKGKQGFESFPLDTVTSGGKATATADLSQYANAIEEAAYSGETATGKRDYSAEFAQKQAAAVGSGVNVKIAVYFFCETEYLVTSDAGHFQIYVPKSSWSSQEEAVKGKLNKQDAKRIVEDLESILSYYQKTYKIKRTSWPMKVILGTDNDGQFGSGRMKLNWAKLDNGYGRDMKTSQALYQTMAHELFHFVQREYTPVVLSQSWFDEASGSYYGIVLGSQRSGSLSDAIRNENYFADAEAQYQGIAPMDVATLGWFDFLHAGYGRASFIDYLMKNFGSDFLKRYYEEGVTLAGMQTESRLEKLTGKTLGQLAEDFYCKLVLEKDSVMGVLNIPSDIWQRKYSAGGDEGEASLDAVRTTWTLTGKDERTTISVPRYGAYFTALDTSKLKANPKAFTLTVPTADCAARLIAIRSDGENQYASQKVYQPDSSGKFEAQPINGAMYLLMMINTTGSWGWTVSEQLSITYENLSDGGPYPASFNEIPQRYSGPLTFWTGGLGGTLTGPTTATVTAEYENGSLFFTISSPQLDSSVIGSTKGFLNSDGTADCITSDGKHMLVQMKGGEYIDRTKGPQPTEEQKEEMELSPFGLHIPGKSVTNGIRILYYDRFDRLCVFEGTGTNDDSFNYDPPITIPT